MSDITIFPIFNQAVPRVWDDFIRIRIAAMRVNYNLEMTADDIAHAMQEMQSAWNHYAFNFAFGAYDGADMVGCIHGDCSQRVASIRHLYVLPEYQGLRIGSRLMSAAEAAVSVAANKLDLVALGHAEDFYKKRGCTSPLNTNVFVKDIVGGGRCQAVPLFWCPTSVSRACDDLSRVSNCTFDAGRVNQEHRPTFVYRDVNSNIVGYGIVGTNSNNTDDVRVCTQFQHAASFVLRRLNNVVNGYCAHASLLANKYAR